VQLPRSLAAVSLAVLCASAACTTTEVSARKDSPPRGETAATSVPTGGDPGGDPGGSAVPGGALCAAAQRIRDLGDQASGLMNDVYRQTLSQDPSAAEQQLLDAVAAMQPLVPELADAYDDLRGAVPADLADDVDTLRSFTVEVMDQMANASSIEDLMAVVEGFDEDATVAAATATLELDAHTRAECNVTIAN